jgi:hypothetical protein
MDTALIGLVGVIAGAILTGGIQVAVGWFDRRLAARSSARLLYTELHAADEIIGALLETPIWSRMIFDWRQPGAMWEKHREALARVLATDDFLKVSSAFSSIANLAQASELDAQRPASTPMGAPPRFSVPNDILDLYGTQTETAMRVILKAAYTWWEIRRRKSTLIV